MRHPALLLSLLLVPLASSALAAQAGDPVAIVVRTSGTVQARSPGAAAVAAGPGTQLRAGTQLLVAGGGSAILLYRSGRTQTLTRNTIIAAPASAQQPGVFRQTVRTLGEVAVINARAQPNRQGMIRPVAGAAVPVAPRNGITLPDGHPTLRWLALPAPSRYTVQIRPLAGGPPRRFDAGRDTVWTLPAAEAELAPGAEYEWSVQGEEMGRAMPPQRFRVISRAGADSVAAALAELRQAGLDPEQSGLLPAALVYRGAGEVYEARRALERMQALGVGSGVEFQRLLYDVYNATGQLELARRAWLAAGGSAGTQF